jgi:crotonobetainyl-CoA:carnitine CoA-transferase CaiB-like acyl-CoA transferase
MDLLSGTRVISFNHFLAGPGGAQILGDLGADVIAVEPPEGVFQRNWAVGNCYVDGQSVNFLCTGRNKRSIALNLRQPEGRAIALKLASRADVVMENFRPGTMEKLGLGYEQVCAVNPRVIYASASGFGSTGPYRDRPGQDLLAQALSGIAARTGNADGPPVPAGPTIVDQHSAVVYAMGIMAALLGRVNTGKGRRVEVNLLSSALDLQYESLTCYLNGGRSPSPRGPGNLAAWFSPAPYGVYATKDGYIAISMTLPKLVATAFSLPEFADLPDDASFEQRERIAGRVREVVAGHDTAHWLEVLSRHQVWHAKVNDYPDVVNDPQIKHNDSLQTLPGTTGAPITLVMHPVKYDGQTPEVRLVPQPLGAQTRAVLGEIGYSGEQIQAFEAGGTIVCGRDPASAAAIA